MFRLTHQCPLASIVGVEPTHRPEAYRNRTGLLSRVSKRRVVPCSRRFVFERFPLHVRSGHARNRFEDDERLPTVDAGEPFALSGQRGDSFDFGGIE